MTNKLEDKFVKSLGVLDEESKKIIWNTCISGSQIKKMFYNIRDLYNEKKTVGVEKVFSEKAEEKMKMGRLIEPFIRETASKEFGLKIEYLPDTFAQIANPFFTANIDGFIETEEGLEIVEIKNTEEEDMEKLYEYYKYQIQYYLWFFNAKRARLIALSKGWKLQQLIVERDEPLQMEIVDRANALSKALTEGVFDEMYFSEEEKRIDEANVIIKYLEEQSEISEKINKLKDLKDNAVTIDTMIKELESEIKDIYADDDNKVSLVTDRCTYTLSTIPRKGTINYKQYFKDNNISDTDPILEQYRGKETKVIRGVFTNL